MSAAHRRDDVIMGESLILLTHTTGFHPPALAAGVAPVFVVRVVVVVGNSGGRSGGR